MRRYARRRAPSGWRMASGASVDGGHDVGGFDGGACLLADREAERVDRFAGRGAANGR
jgi:hypothetical protein